MRLIFLIHYGLVTCLNYQKYCPIIRTPRPFSCFSVTVHTHASKWMFLCISPKFIFSFCTNISLEIFLSTFLSSLPLLSSFFIAEYSLLSFFSLSRSLFFLLLTTYPLGILTVPIFPGFAFSHAFLYNHLIRTEVIDMPHPTIEQLMIQNLQKQNDALQIRCQTLEELLDTKEALILNQNKLILNLQALCDKQQTLLDELSDPQ